MMRLGLALLLGVVVWACDPAPGPLVRVRVVVVDCEKRIGEDDCTTWVELPNGERLRRTGRVGNVGDSITARRVSPGYWR